MRHDGNTKLASMLCAGRHRIAGYLRKSAVNTMLGWPHAALALEPLPVEFLCLNNKPHYMCWPTFRLGLT
jgi:hypothetical protein